ncbi:MAG: hypothetical protein HY696_01285 [Deltaproteobacteria bacterium]|nr:hypothetical protein [Deltaproteobacteria bacterium]
MHRITCALLLTCCCTLVACRGSTSDSTTTASTAAGTEATAAGVAALFGGINSDNNLARGAKTLATSQTICNNLAGGAGKVLMFGYGGPSAAQTFGSQSDPISVGPDDFCLDDNQDALAGDAAVGGYRFAAFSFLDAIEGDCDSSTLTMTRGSGIVRNTDSYMPEIYGRFEIGGAVTDCTFRITTAGVLDLAHSSCTDLNGAAVTLDSSLSCTMSADTARLTLPTTMEGHYGVTTDDGSNVGYDCWALYPLDRDADGFTTITNDCTTFNHYGFNVASFNVGLIVNAGGAIFRTTDLNQLGSRIKILRQAGYPVLLSVDMLYVAAYDGTPGSVADGENFPQALIDEHTFISTLSEEVYALAEWAERADVEIFAPMSEADRIFNQSLTTNAAASYLQAIRPDLEARFTGALMWVGQAFDSTDSAKYNLTGFDYAAVNISPMPNHLSEADFTTHVQTQLGNLRTLATALGIPYLISNAGMWGEALTNAYDWDATETKVVSAFRIMKDQSDAYGTAGIIFWEGASGEVVFADHDPLNRYIATQFGGTVSAFYNFGAGADSATDGGFDGTLTDPALTWSTVTGPLFMANGMTMAAYNGKLYLFGGSSAAAGTKTQIYDIAGDSWSQGTAMPRYRESAVAVELNGSLYVIGGTDPDTCGGDYRCGQLTEVDIYNPATNAWTTAGALNEKRDVAGAVVYDDKIYVVGGMHSASGDVQVSNRDSIEVYDPATNLWTVLERNIPYPIRSAATTLVDDRIYVIGGCSEHDADLTALEADNTCQQTVVQFYDIGDGIWDIADDNMPTGRHFSGQHVVATSDWILVYGGATDLSATIFADVEAFNLTTNTWASATALQAPRKSSASAVYDGFLYVTGGAEPGVAASLFDGMERAAISGL